MTRDEAIELVQKHIAQLSEHFDSVQIFVTRHDGESGSTLGVNLGEGNWYARRGHVEDWLTAIDNVTASEAIEDREERKNIEPEEPE